MWCFTGLIIIIIVIIAMEENRPSWCLSWNILSVLIFQRLNNQRGDIFKLHQSENQFDHLKKYDDNNDYSNLYQIPSSSVGFYSAHHHRHHNHRHYHHCHRHLHHRRHHQYQHHHPFQHHRHYHPHHIIIILAHLLPIIIYIIHQSKVVRFDDR